MKALGKNICYQLEKHNLTQRYLAWKLGVTESAMSRWCRGEREPRVSIVYAMSKIFGCTMDELMGLPPAEPQIIRCKDCKHWIPYDWMFSEIWQSKNIADYPEDEIGCAWCDMAMKANDFCSRGERRTE
jgi:transcriptional regulator with XRE-family HTH domain